METHSTGKMPVSRQMKFLKLILSHWLLITVALVMMLPFAWMVLASTKTLTEIENPDRAPSIVHRKLHWENYRDVFKMGDASQAKRIAGSGERISFATYYFNSLFVAMWVTFLQTLTSAMAAY